MPFGQAVVSWNQNPEADLAGYVIYYGTVPTVLPFSQDVGLTTTPTSPTFTMTNFQIYGQLYFAVSAYDNATPLRNESAPSSPSVSKAVAPKLFPMSWP